MPWSYGSWINNYMCNQCLSPLTLWVRITLVKRCTILCDKVCQWLAAGRWFSLVSSTNKTDCHDLAEISLKVALNSITLTLFLWSCSDLVLHCSFLRICPLYCLLCWLIIRIVHRLTLFILKITSRSWLMYW